MRCFLHDPSVSFAFTLRTSPSIPDPAKEWVLQDPRFPSTCPTWASSVSSFLTFLCHPRTKRNEPTLFAVQKSSIPIRLLSPNEFEQEFLEWSFSNPAKGCPCEVLSSGATWSCILPQDCGHRERGTRIPITGQSDLGNLDTPGASFIFTWVQADTASLPSPAQFDEFQQLKCCGSCDMPFSGTRTE